MSTEPLPSVLKARNTKQSACSAKALGQHEVCLPLDPFPGHRLGLLAAPRGGAAPPGLHLPPGSGSGSLTGRSSRASGARSTTASLGLSSQSLSQPPAVVHHQVAHLHHPEVCSLLSIPSANVL